jgi:hypothetical protein
LALTTQVRNPPLSLKCVKPDCEYIDIGTTCSIWLEKPSHVCKPG